MGNMLVNNKPVLQEYISSGQSRMMADPTDYVDENGNRKKHWYLKGIFIQGEIQNLNGRIYPRHEIESAVNDLSEQIQMHGGVLGELDHPDTLVINVHNVSHLIEEIHMKGNDGIGKMKILSNTPSGKIVEGLLQDGVPLGVSSRGSGNVSDYDNTVSDFEIVTVDIVATPSAQDARPTPIYEKLMYTGSGQKLLNNAQDLINSSSSRYESKLNEDIVSWFRNWSCK
jgi:hypothetical protein|uniref:Prohead core protein serine protease n=1 Tax=Myoviridae sp. ctWb16 TaxID=2827690 RepID=A0A8S5T047_9CAUD|nr:MAG TPA: Prohead core protein serine protease [Myoviridae sp. ctWb16]